jgi:hypothetical protein
VNGSAAVELPGVGYYASTRAGDNGEINRAYKDTCGANTASGKRVELLEGTPFTRYRLGRVNETEVGR